MIEALPGKRLRHFARMGVKYAKRPRRYRRLLMAAESKSPATILEIGVFTGVRGVEMLEAASLSERKAKTHYVGFDLFDIMDGEILEKELSKQPDNIDMVKTRLAGTGADVELVKGWTHETLPEYAHAHPDYKADLIFIDGGHSIETIQSDWDNVQSFLTKDSVVIFDDYYVDCPHLTDEYGCNQLVDGLDRAVWDVQIHAEVDRFVHDDKPHNVSVVEVRMK